MRPTIALVLAFAAALLAAVPAPAQVRPNVLLFVSDDQPSYSLPEMERTLRRFDVTYTNGFVTTPLCCPSRASIFSGKYAHNHGIVDSDGRGFDAYQTWQRHLHQAGYRTGIVGKYLNMVGTHTARHFDLARDTSTVSQTKYWARSFLIDAERDDATPWALVVADRSPHTPHDQVPAAPQPIPPFQQPPSMGETDKSDKHPVVSENDNLTLETWTSLHNGIHQEVQALDETVGGVFAAAKVRGELGSTLAFYLSDNGFLVGEHDLGAKRWPYLESVRVPFLMRWDGHTPNRTTDPQLVANIDIAATIYDAAGLTPDYAVDGRSLLAAGPQREWLFLESDESTALPRPSWASYVAAGRQYIHWEDGFVEDYDLGSDPYELAALGTPDPAVEAMLAAAAGCTGANCP